MDSPANLEAIPESDPRLAALLATFIAAVVLVAIVLPSINLLKLLGRLRGRIAPAAGSPSHHRPFPRRDRGLTPSPTPVA